MCLNFTILGSRLKSFKTLFLKPLLSKEKSLEIIKLYLKFYFFLKSTRICISSFSMYVSMRQTRVLHCKSPNYFKL